MCIRDSFWVGNFEFDPKHVGFVSDKFPGGFLLDTRIKGNGNGGHEFRDGCRNDGAIGRGLQPEERWALVEYLKVLGNPALENQLSDVPVKPWNPGQYCQGSVKANHKESNDA